jgi:hypothetical protein
MRREGYLMIDHRASPGLEDGFMTKIGLNGPSLSEGKLFESGIATCSHCNTVVILQPLRTRDRGHCQKCDAYICDNPACHKDCTPFNKVLDIAETRAYREQQNNLTLRFNLKEYNHG